MTAGRHPPAANAGELQGHLRDDLPRDPHLQAALRHAPDAELPVPPLLRAGILAAARRQAERQATARAAGWSGLRQQLIALWATPWRMGGTGTLAAALLAATVLWVGRDEQPDRPSKVSADAPAAAAPAPRPAPVLVPPEKDAAGAGAVAGEVAASAERSAAANAQRAEAAAHPATPQRRDEAARSDERRAPARVAAAVPLEEQKRRAGAADRDSQEFATPSQRSTSSKPSLPAPPTASTTQPQQPSADAAAAANAAAGARPQLADAAVQGAARATTPAAPSAGAASPAETVAQVPAPAAAAPTAAPAAPHPTGAVGGGMAAAASPSQPSSVLRQERASLLRAAPPQAAAERERMAEPAFLQAWLNRQTGTGWRWRAPSGAEAVLPAAWLQEFAAATRTAWTPLPSNAIPGGEVWLLLQQGQVRARVVWASDSVVLCETNGLCQTARLAAPLTALREALR